MIKVSLTEPAWTGFGVEAYWFAAVGYFFFCYPMSRDSQALEREGAPGGKIQMLRENRNEVRGIVAGPLTFIESSE
jgi:hypothetical protein